MVKSPRKLKIFVTTSKLGALIERTIGKNYFFRCLAPRGSFYRQSTSILMGRSFQYEAQTTSSSLELSTFTFEIPGRP